MRQPNDRRRLVGLGGVQMDLFTNPEEAIHLAQTETLSASFILLQTKIASWRAVVGVGNLTPDQTELIAGQVQALTVRVRAVVRELRRRGFEVTWDE